MSNKHNWPSCRFAATAVVAAAALMSAGPMAVAQTPNQGDIVITAVTRDEAQSFVSQVAIAPPSAEQMGRWNSATCVGVVGLPARQGQFIADRVAQRAFAVGLEPGSPGCAPNISVVVAPDGNAMAQQMFSQDESLFAYRSETGVSTLGRPAFETFLTTERPVRWWHVTHTMSSDGEAIAGGNASPTTAGGLEVQTVRSSGSRIRGTTRQDFSRVVIIVDGRRVGGVQMAALADYIALVALAQTHPNADTSAYPTILNLFSASDGAPTQMTQWDLAYLDALYATERDAPSVVQHQSDIARRMIGRPGS